MGLFTVDRLEQLLTAGCASCGASARVFRAYVDAVVPMMVSEPVGKLTWAYDGEKFVDGVFEITCARCAAVGFSASVCPRCHADGGLEKALATENDFPAPPACPRCEGEEVRLVAFVPAKVLYEGKRADKARTHVEPHEPGFHGYRIDCKRCGVVAKLEGRCPLCAAPGPLRARPA